MTAARTDGPAPALPRPPVLVDHVLDDPSVVRALVAEHAPYWPVQRYVANQAEYAALSGSSSSAPMPVAPVFRGNWALHGEAVRGVEPLLRHEPFVEAARTLFGAEIVRPETVYVNLTWQLPFFQGRGHTDIPAFRGFTRDDHPVTFLTIMGLSGLFETERVQVATAVAWFYEGADGGFEYWPQGPDGERVVHEGSIDNTAVVGDNDFMWHRVRPTGRVEDGMVTLDLDSELVRVGAGHDHDWAIVGRDATIATFDDDRLRCSLSWKALAFGSDDDRRRHDDHLDDLELTEVLRRFTADLAARGIDAEPPPDPERDPAYIDLLARTYVRYPAD